MKYIIGLDGGGTKMAVLMTDLDGNPVKTAKFGPSNVHDLGIDEFGKRLAEIPAALGIDDVNEVAAVFGGLAGGTAYRHRINEHMERVFPKAKCRNGTDAENILWAGLGADDGCGLISGTGSILYARENGNMHRIGGWGWIMDPAGSGYDLGRDAVFAALREFDGRDGHTMLTDLFYEKFGKDILASLREILNGGKTFIASFAPMVFEAYRCGDRKAAEIMNKTADALAEMIDCAAKYFEGDYRVALAGSIMTKEPEMAELVKGKVNERALLTVLDREPVEGAVEAAKHLLTLDVLPPISEE